MDQYSQGPREEKELAFLRDFVDSWGRDRPILFPPRPFLLELHKLLHEIKLYFTMWQENMGPTNFFLFWVQS